MPLYKRKPQPLPPARYPPPKWWEVQPPDSPSPAKLSGRGGTSFSTTTTTTTSSTFSKPGSSTSHSSKLRTILSSLGHCHFSLRRCRCPLHSSRVEQYDDATISTVSTGTQCSSDNNDEDDEDEAQRQQDNERIRVQPRGRTPPFADDHSDTYDDIKQWLAQRKRQYQHQGHRQRAASPLTNSIINPTTTTTTSENRAKDDSQAGNGGDGGGGGEQPRRRHYEIQWRDEPQPVAFSSLSSSSSSYSPTAASFYARAYQRRPTRSRQTRIRMSPGVGTLVPTENEYPRDMAAMMRRNVKDVLTRLEGDRINGVDAAGAADRFQLREEAEEEERCEPVVEFERSGEEEEEEEEDEDKDSASVSSGASISSFGSVHTVSSIAFGGFPALITIENQHQQKEGKQTITRDPGHSHNHDDEEGATRESPEEVSCQTSKAPSPPVQVHPPPLVSLSNKSFTTHLANQRPTHPKPHDIEPNQTTNTFITTTQAIQALLYFTLELPHNGGFVRSHPIHTQPLALDLSTRDHQIRAVQHLRAHLERIGFPAGFPETDTGFDDKYENTPFSDGSAAAAAAAAAAAGPDDSERAASNNDDSKSKANGQRKDQTLAINFPQLFSPHHPFRSLVEKRWGPSLRWAWVDASEPAFPEVLVVLLGKIGEEHIKMQRKSQTRTTMMADEVADGGGCCGGGCRSGLRGSTDSALSGLDTLMEGERDWEGEKRERTVTLDVVCVVRRMDGSSKDGDGYGMPMDVRTTASGFSERGRTRKSSV